MTARVRKHITPARFSVWAEVRCLMGKGAGNRGSNSWIPNFTVSAFQKNCKKIEDRMWTVCFPLVNSEINWIITNINKGCLSMTWQSLATWDQFHMNLDLNSFPFYDIHADSIFNPWNAKRWKADWKFCFTLAHSELIWLKGILKKRCLFVSPVHNKYKIDS